MSHSPPESPAPSHEELIEAVHRLSDEVRVLRDVVDEIRELLSYDQRNSSTVSGHSILKQMAVDPTSEAWGEQLVITRPSTGEPSPDPGTETETKQDAMRQPSSRSAKPGQLF